MYNNYQMVIHGVITTLLGGILILIVTKVIAKFRDKPSVKIRPKGTIHIGHGGTTKLTAQIRLASSGPFEVHWQRIENNIPTNLLLNIIKYSGSSSNVASPELVINDVCEKDSGIYIIAVTCVSTAETHYSSPFQIEVFGETDGNAFTIEEKNFLRFYLLCYELGTESVCLFFNRHVPEAALQSHLKAHENQLKKSQCAPLLYKVGVKSSTFDLPSLYTLIRNTILNLQPPKQGWGIQPNPSDTTETDDIERIRHYRNDLAHNTCLQLSDNDFNSYWFDLSEAIKRLSHGTLSDKVKLLAHKTFDKHVRIQLAEKIKEDIKQTKDMLMELQEDVVKCKAILDTRHIPQHIRKRQEELLKQWENDDKVFYEGTKAYIYAYTMVNNHSIVTITGSPGTGKTATARHIALKLSMLDCEIVPVYSLDEILQYLNTEIKQVFIIDDILGMFAFDMSMLHSVNRHKDIMLLTKSKFIFTSRKSVYNVAVRYRPFIFENTADLQSKECELSMEEKKLILKNHCTHAGIDERHYKMISIPDANIMFPFLCKLFSTQLYQQKGCTFFEKRHKCIIEEVEKLWPSNPVQYAALVLCFMNDRKISVFNIPGGEINICVPSGVLKTDIYSMCGLDACTSDKKILDALCEMIDTFINKTESEFTFIHDCISEIIAYHVWGLFPELILKHMPAIFIASNLNVCTLDQSENEMCITVGNHQYHLLAKRFYQDIKSFRFFEVFTSKSLYHNGFLDAFINVLKETEYQELKSLFLFEQNHGFLEVLKLHAEKINKLQINLNQYVYNDNIFDTETQLQLLFDIRESETKVSINCRVVSWLVYYQHCTLLKYIVHRVIKSGESTDVVFGENIEEQTRLLVLGCYTGNVDMIKIIIQYVRTDCLKSSSMYYDENIYDCSPTPINNFHRSLSPLTAACQFGHFDALEVLVNCKADLDMTDDNLNTAVFLASEFARFDMVKLLLENGADPNKWYECSPLYVATIMGSTDIVKILAEYGANINACGYCMQTPLFVACWNGNADIIRYLLQKGADIYLSDTNNQTPLHMASQKGHFESVQVLIENKESADQKYIDQTDQFNCSPIYEASANGHSKIVKYLADKGANVNLTNNTLKSPLYVACEHGHCNVVKELVELGADVYQCDKDFLSPLHVALEKGHLDIVKVLLEPDIDLQKFKLSPISTALWMNELGVVQTLIRMENKSQTNSGSYCFLNLMATMKHNDFDSKLKNVNKPHNYYSCITEEFWGFIKRNKGYHLNNLLKLGLDPNSILEGRPLLLKTIIEDGVQDKTLKVRILVENGARLNDRYDKCMSVLEITRTETCDKKKIVEELNKDVFSHFVLYSVNAISKNYTNYERLFKEYTDVLSELKKHVRRNSF